MRLGPGPGKVPIKGAWPVAGWPETSVRNEQRRAGEGWLALKASLTSLFLQRTSVCRGPVHEWKTRVLPTAASVHRKAKADCRTTGTSLFGSRTAASSSSRPSRSRPPAATLASRMARLREQNSGSTGEHPSPDAASTTARRFRPGPAAVSVYLPSLAAAGEAL